MFLNFAINGIGLIVGNGGKIDVIRISKFWFEIADTFEFRVEYLKNERKNLESRGYHQCTLGIIFAMLAIV